VGDETPGSWAGLKADDFIAEIDNEGTEGQDLTGVAEKLRGLPNSEVRLKILRPGHSNIKPIELSITRQQLRTSALKP
jgi:carboxyl-terminal processing protease